MGSPYPEGEGDLRVNGHRLFYRRLGQPLRGSLLVVHGGPSDHRYLTCLADLVPHGFEVVWFDQWGCGQSGRPRSYRGYTMATAGADVVAVVNALRLRPVHLFGHSWGGALALEAVTQAPRRFRSLSVCGGFPSEGSFLSAMRRHIHALPRTIRIPIERGERERHYRDPANLRDVRRRRKEYSLGMRVLPFEMAVTEPDMNLPLLRAIYGERPGLLSPFTGTLRGWDVREALGRLSLPSLVLAGEREAGRYTARELHARLRGSRLALIPGAAHLPFLQERDHFMQVLLDFLLRVSRRPTGARRP